jgi:hypothetical protein
MEDSIPACSAGSAIFPGKGLEERHIDQCTDEREGQDDVGRPETKTTLFGVASDTRSRRTHIGRYNSSPLDFTLGLHQARGVPR